jgi:hypothetical protein
MAVSTVKVAFVWVATVHSRSEDIHSERKTHEGDRDFCKDSHHEGSDREGLENIVKLTAKPDVRLGYCVNQWPARACQYHVQEVTKVHAQ